MFIPIGDDNSRRVSTPFIVIGLITLNSLAWFMQLSSGENLTMGFSAVPYEISHGIDLVGIQVLSIQDQQIPIEHFPGPNPIYLTLISSMFLHGSWLHLIGNMLYLWIFGDQIEDLLGHFRFLFFYLFCGLIAGISQIIMDPNSTMPLLGASGAISGVLGAYLFKFSSNKVRVLFFRDIIILPATFVLGSWFLLQIFGQFGSALGESGVAYMAHIGGFLAGVILVLLFERKIYREA